MQPREASMSPFARSVMAVAWPAFLSACLLSGGVSLALMRAESTAARRSIR